MIKGLTVVRDIFIVGLLMLSIFTIVSPNISADSNFDLPDALKETNKTGILSFPAYIEMDFDTSPLDKPLIIDQAVSVPVEITYKHGIPKKLYNLIPFPLVRNQFFFGSAMAPMIQIQLDVKKPDWANVYFAQPSIIMEMPMPEEKSTVQTELIISPYREAPARAYTLEITASSNVAGKVQSTSRLFTVTFTPSYIPMINVEVDKPVREVSPKETVNIPIKVTNNANKNTIVKFSYDAPSEWAPIINPPEIELPPLGTGTVTFSVQAPYSLGWHDEPVHMRVICQPYPSPLSGNLSQYEIGAQFADIRIVNYGFSIAGIEPLLMVLVILIVIVVIVWFYQKKRKK